MAATSSSHPFFTTQPGGLRESRSWSPVAPHFAGKLATGTIEAARKMAAMALELKPLVSTTSRVLDAGAGSGAITETVRALDPEVPIVAVDKVPGMVEFLARKNISNVTTGLADVTAMVGQDRGGLVPEAGFTHAFAALVVQFCGEHQTDMLTELFRAVEPGGVAGASITRDITVREPWHLACERLDPESYRRFETHDAPPVWMSADEVDAGMRAVGFRDTRSATLPIEFTWDSAEDYIKFWFEGGHPGLRKEMRGWEEGLGRDPDEVRLEVEKAGREQFDGAPRLGCNVDIVVGRRPV
ncbi:hypothetical protein PG987_014914 [Apiospora arundinis]